MLNVIAATALFVVDGGADISTVSGLMTALGHLSGLYGALGLALQLVLIARVPWLEQRLGMDRLTGWHRWSGVGVLGLLVAHVVFATLGSAAAYRKPVLSEAGILLFDVPDVFQAAAAMVLLVVVATSSARTARRRMRYETWHFVHLCAYLAVILGFFHQVAIGRDFVDAPLGRLY